MVGIDIRSVMFKRVLVWAVPVLVLVGVLVILLRPRAEFVDIVEVSEQPMLVTIDEEGETRAREIFTIPGWGAIAAPRAERR